MAALTRVSIRGDLTIELVSRILHDGLRIELDADALADCERNRAALETAIDRGHPIYGVTTGLGALVARELTPESTREAQAALLRSHAAGVGDPLPRPIVRSAMTIRLNGIMKGHSGIRTEVLDRIVQLLNADLVPIVPRVGSLGASGDLAPSAHAFLPLIGEGSLTDGRGEVVAAADALRRIGVSPIALREKEALALVNGTHFMTALGVEAVRRLEHLLDVGDLVAGMSVVALNGRHEPFDPRVHALRPLAGQMRSAANVRGVLSEVGAGNRPHLQDAYSLRCVPQVHGAAREGAGFLRSMVEIDLNAATDNPLVFADPLEVVSAGNFHGQSLSLAFDVARLVLADLGSISERRTFRLVSPSLSNGLPPFLTPEDGASHGYMIAQYTAAALVGELKAAAAPMSTDSIPSSDNQEDHISFGMGAGLATLHAVDLLTKVLAIELLCVAQALGFRDGVRGAVRIARDAVRNAVSPLREDRPPADDIAAIERLIERGELAEATASLPAA